MSRRRGSLDFALSTFLPALTAILLCGTALDALAAQTTWDAGPGGTGTLWNDPANWVGDALPASGDTVLLDNSVQSSLPGTMYLNQDFIIRSLQFGSTNTVLVRGDSAGTLRTLALTGDGTTPLIDVSQPGSLALSRSGFSYSSSWDLNLNVGASGGTFHVVPGGTLAINGDILGSGIITITGGGTVVTRELQAANGPAYHKQFKGKWVVTENSTLTLNALSRISPLGETPAFFVPDKITLNGGRLNQKFYPYCISPSCGITLGSAGGSLVDNNQAYYYCAFTGAGSLTLSPSGNTLYQKNTYTGGTTIQSGTVRLGVGNALPAGGNLTVRGGALEMGTNSQSVGTLTMSGGTIQTSATGYKSVGPCVLTLGGDVTYDATYAGAAEARIQSSVNLGSVGRRFIVGDGPSTGDLWVDGKIYGGPASGNGLIKDGPGTLTLYYASNRYTGATIVNAGTLSLYGNSTPPLSPVSLTAAGARLKVYAK